jgi:DNA-binding NarL/FixJ family response regulator
MGPLRVRLAVDHAIVRRGLRGLLEAAGFAVVAEVADGLKAVRLCTSSRPTRWSSRSACRDLSGIEVARAPKLERPDVIMSQQYRNDLNLKPLSK